MKYSNIDYEAIFFTYDNIFNISYMSDVMNYLSKEMPMNAI